MAQFTAAAAAVSLAAGRSLLKAALVRSQPVPTNVRIFRLAGTSVKASQAQIELEVDEAILLETFEIAA